MWAHVLFGAMGNQPASAWSAGGGASQTHDRADLPPTVALLFLGATGVHQGALTVEKSHGSQRANQYAVVPAECAYAVPRWEEWTIGSLSTRSLPPQQKSAQSRWPGCDPLQAFPPLAQYQRALSSCDVHQCTLSSPGYLLALPLPPRPYQRSSSAVIHHSAGLVASTSRSARRPPPRWGCAAT